jgi:type VI secretion system secreted protein VgrG
MTLDRTTVFANPLGPGPLLFYAMSGREALGQPFVYEVDLLSEDPNLDLSVLLGQPASVALERNDATIRYFHGIVTHFALAGEHGRFIRYRAVLRPWLWLLSNRTNSRIFQNKTVPDVLKAMFREHGFTDFEELLSGEYRSWEFLVQYRESDLNFVSRLMEQEGIYYFFKHEEGKHTLVLSDSYSAHEPAPTNEELPYYPPLERERRDVEHINGWLASRRIRSGSYTAKDYNFKRPATLLDDVRKAPNDHAHAEYELFDYPGDFLEPPEAKQQTKIRFEENQVEYEVVEANATARSLFAGTLFTLVDFPREDQNKEYLVTEAIYELRTSEYESGKSEDIEPDYRLRFRAIDSKRQFRTPRVTKKPIVEGPQTAVVVGKKDQEIWTDEFGRVKVQFFWDREGEYDENSSCFVRVAQIWAGTKWGGMHLPRIGQEVIVDFLEGDPDRPIITGRVYNADNMPPYTLPDNQTQSGIKSRSTKGGTPDNFNELRFEDKKGEEHISIQAEKDFNTLVKHDRTTNILRNDTLNITGDQFIKIHGNLSMIVEGVTEKDNPDKAKPVKSSLGVTGAHRLDASDTIDIQAPNKITLTCGGSTIVMTPGSITLSAGGSTVAIDANVFSMSKGGSHTMLDANAFMQASGGASMLLDANACTQSSGGSQLLLDADASLSSSGEVGLSGMKVTGKGQTEAGLDGGGSVVTLTPASADLSGAQVNVSGKGVVSIGGPLVKIG